MLAESRNVLGAEQVYRRAIDRRKTSTRPDRYQILLSEVRLAQFLQDYGNREEARELLATAQGSWADAPECFDWLVERINNELARSVEPQVRD